MPADLTFTCLETAPEAACWDDSAPVYASPHCLDDGSSWLRLYRGIGFEVLEIAGVARYFVGPERVFCHLLSPAGAELVQVYLLGPVMAFWLERAGVPALHAAGVSVDGRAIGLLSFSTGGKSTLAAGLLERGHALLADDILSLETRGDIFLARPAFPSLRLWPVEASHWIQRWEDLEQVTHKAGKRHVPVGPQGLGAFCASARPLACLYLPRRREAGAAGKEVAIDSMPRRGAVIELLRHSFAARLVEPLGLSASRLDLFARLVGKVPVRRLDYPSGLDELPRVSQALERDLEGLAP